MIHEHKLYFHNSCFYSRLGKNEINRFLLCFDLKYRYGTIDEPPSESSRWTALGLASAGRHRLRNTTCCSKGKLKETKRRINLPYDSMS